MAIKIRYSVLLFLIMFFGLSRPSFAQTLCPKTSAFGTLCNIYAWGNLIPGLISLLIIVTIIIAIFYIIWGGFKWITSGGDKAKLQAAREHVIAAIIGLIVIFLVYFIVSFVLTLFGLKGFIWNFPTINNVSG